MSCALRCVPDSVTLAEDSRARDELNQWLAGKTAEQRVAFARHSLAGAHVLSSSFGAQSAVLIHIVTRVDPQIPVVLIDTGYLFPETYAFIDQLTERLSLNLQVYRPQLSPSWLEARHGRLWEQGLDGIVHYNRLAKIEPMRRALDELDARTWFAGLRRAQSDSRELITPLMLQEGRWKVHPLFDWSNRDLHRYLQRHKLPYHPLWEQGYPSIGDIHTTRRWEPGMREQDTRFFGAKRECGLHEGVADD